LFAADSACPTSKFSLVNSNNHPQRIFSLLFLFFRLVLFFLLFLLFLLLLSPLFFDLPIAFHQNSSDAAAGPSLSLKRRLLFCFGKEGLDFLSLVEQILVFIEIVSELIKDIGYFDLSVRVALDSRAKHLLFINQFIMSQMQFFHQVIVALSKLRGFARLVKPLGVGE
jgi:hypothetical protein